MKNSKQSFGHVNLSPELADQNQRTLEQVMIEIQEIINNTHWEETRLTQLKAKGYQIEHCWVKNGSIGVIWNMNGKKVFRIQVTESELHGKYYKAYCVIIPITDISIEASDMSKVRNSKSIKDAKSMNHILLSKKITANSKP